jgi:hypothetical protein
MLRRLTCLFTIAGGCLLVTMPSQAQKEKKAETPKEQIQEERIRKLMTAYDLAAQGRDKNAPEYLITAAGLLRQLSTIKDLQNMKKLTVKVEAATDKAPAAEVEVPMPNLAKQSDEWFKEASDAGAALGVNVDKLIKLAKDRAAEEESKLPEEQRAVVGGPKFIYRVSAPGQVDVYTLTLIKEYPTTFAFGSSIPMRVSIVHGNFVWLNMTGASCQRTFLASSDNRTIVIRVQNATKLRATYQMAVQ